MTERTITFTPEAELRKGLYSLAHGFRLTATGTVKIYDKSVRKYPYAHIVAILIVSLIISFLSVAGARQERDAATKRNYELTKRIETLENAIEARKETAYATSE